MYSVGPRNAQKSKMLERRQKSGLIKLKTNDDFLVVSLRFIYYANPSKANLKQYSMLMLL